MQTPGKFKMEKLNWTKLRRNHPLRIAVECKGYLVLVLMYFLVREQVDQNFFYKGKLSSI